MSAVADVEDDGLAGVGGATQVDSQDFAVVRKLQRVAVDLVSSRYGGIA